MILSAGKTNSIHCVVVYIKKVKSRFEGTFVKTFVKKKKKKKDGNVDDNRITRYSIFPVTDLPFTPSPPPPKKKKKTNNNN